MGVPGMGRVEGAAEQADPPPRRRPEAHARSGQGRTRGIGEEGRRRITQPARGERAVARAGEEFNERPRLSTRARAACGRAVRASRHVASRAPLLRGLPYGRTWPVPRMTYL